MSPEDVLGALSNSDDLDEAGDDEDAYSLAAWVPPVFGEGEVSSN